jgi:tetratricopeptide (TPR) repeat protein
LAGKVLQTKYTEIGYRQYRNQGFQQELSILQQRRNQASQEVICEIEGTCGSYKVGHGPAFREKQQKYRQSIKEYDKKRRELEKQIDENNQRIDKLIKESDLELKTIVNKRAKADDIMTQIKSLDRLSIKEPIYSYVNSLIIFMFVFTGVAPILVQALLKRSLYDIALEKEEEIAEHDALLKIRSDSHETWHNRGNALAELGRLEEASTSYDNALRIKPDDYKVWMDRGIALLNLGKNEEAISSFDNALKFKPDLHEAWYYRGIILLNLGKNEEAISSFDNALKFKSDDAATYYNKACTYALQKNISLALENLKQAINLDSQYLEMAKTDTDFDKIRHDSRFIHLINSQNQNLQ